MSNPAGTLYIVATPIGNLGDLSPRALNILKQVDYIAAEDTRQSKKLLHHFEIRSQLVSHHKFNERKSEQKLLKYLRSGSDVALVSDAGTPLICDPGLGLVRLCHDAGIQVVPIPGPSALTTALSASGYPSDRFLFEGFLPEKKSSRQKLLNAMRYENRTMIFFDSPHRILATLEDISEIFGATHQVFIGRELTKKFETLYSGPVNTISELITGNIRHQKGEFVVIFKGIENERGITQQDSYRIMEILLTVLPLNRAASIAAQITGNSKKQMYSAGLDIQESREKPES